MLCVKLYSLTQTGFTIDGKSEPFWTLAMLFVNVVFPRNQVSFIIIMYPTMTSSYLKLSSLYPIYFEYTGVGCLPTCDADKPPCKLRPAVVCILGHTRIPLPGNCALWIQVLEGPCKMDHVDRYLTAPQSVVTCLCVPESNDCTSAWWCTIGSKGCLETSVGNCLDQSAASPVDSIVVTSHWARCISLLEPCSDKSLGKVYLPVKSLVATTGGMSGHIKIELLNVYKSLVNEGGVLHSEDVFFTHSDWYVLLEHAKGGWLAISLYNQDISSDKHLKCYVEYEIKLLNHFERKSLVFKKNCTFSNGNGWGYEHVMMITDLLNPVKGFVVNNTIVLQLYVAAGPLLKSFLNDKCLKESTTVEISKIVGKNSTLADRSEYLLKEEIGSDCEFIIEGEEQTKIKCSKIFLARASPVFEQMFYGSLGV
uniref:MATH domain-containing protein n=1 Tax=Timema tahoe TaxID=61484 RepID=A0A7R9FPQ7_9NEOP|nr:unnamed protein product [Timema tahoe]